jgi:hypothetical protein
MANQSLMSISDRVQGFLERRRQRSSPAGRRPGESVAPFLLAGLPLVWPCGSEPLGAGWARRTGL